MHKNNRVIETALTIIASIALFLIIILGSFNMMIFNKQFYYEEYSKNSVYDRISQKYEINMTESINKVDSITDNLFKFFRGRERLENFNDNETSHMNDVKSLIDSVQIVYYASIAVFIIVVIYMYIRLKNNNMELIEILSKILFYSSIACLLFFILIFLWAVFYFNVLFYLFHLIFFPQGNWIFDSSSLLIILFSQQFFCDISLRIFIYGIMQAAIIFIIGFWLRKQIRLHNKFKR